MTGGNATVGNASGSISGECPLTVLVRAQPLHTFLL